MELDSSLSWLALTSTPGIAARLSARLLKEFGSPYEVFRAPLRRLESCSIPAPSAQAIVKKQSFKRAEKDLTNLRKVADARVINWTEPEYPQTLLQIYDPPVMLYARGNAHPECAEFEHRGIDAIAHQGAVAVGGRAIGILGTGINVCYPKGHK